MRLITACLRLAAALLCLSFAGCAHGRKPDRPRQALGSAAEIVPDIPFLLRVVEERNDGRSIFVAGELENRVAWDSRDLLLHISSYNSGQLVRENFFHLPQSSALASEGSRLGAGEISRFALSIAAQEVTDYQLELLWGRDARQYQTRASDSGATLLELRDVRLEAGVCEETPCDVPFLVLGEFYNNGNSSVDRVKLAISLVREDEAAPVAVSGEAGSHEEAVEVSGLALASGESRPFRITVASQLPDEVRASVRPYLRVLQIE